MRTILKQHVRRYPDWTIPDLYKLIHQAANGSEHALGDGSQARLRLQQELAQLGPGPDEPLLDPICPDGRFVRVHLRPFTLRHINNEVLLQSFIQTGTLFPPAPARLTSFAKLACQLAQEGVMSFRAEQLAQYIAEMQASGFPAVHHSQRYTQAYSPAYRVIAQELLPRKIVAAA